MFLRFFSALGIVGLLCLAACGGVGSAQVTAAPAIARTAAPQPSVSPTASPTPSPTQTRPAPASTPNITPTRTNTPEPSPTAANPYLLAEIFYTQWDHVLALAWSPDGSLLAVAAGSQVYIYHYPDLAQAAVLPVGLRPSQLAFDPFSPPSSPRLAMAVRDGSLQIWDPLNEVLLASWEAHRKSANSLMFSPDGASLASVGNDAMVRLWDMTHFRTTGEAKLDLLAEMVGGAVAVPAVRFSPDGALLASVDLGLLRLRDPQTQRLVRTLRTETSVFNIEFSPDGRWLAAAELDNQLQVWDATSGELAYTLIVPGRWTGRPFLWAAAFNSAGSLLAAGSSTGRIAVWSAADQASILDVFGHTRGCTSLAFHPQANILATGGLDGVLRIWTLAP